MRFVSTYLRQISAGVRILLVLTVALGIGYPVAITAIAQIPGLRDPANGSMLSRDGKPVGSSIIGQSFTKADGTPLTQYFQSRPSAGDYDPTASGASNLGPESVQDVLPNPKVKGDAGTPSLLTTVCARSLAIGKSDGVDGRRPYCTSDGVGAVLRVFYTTPGYRGAITRVVSVNQACPATPFVTSYGGKRVECARFGADYSAAKLILVRGNAPAESPVPADAITASGSGLDPDISPAYARIQVARVAQARRITAAAVETLVRRHTDGRLIGFVGEPTVNVLELNLDLDRRYPASR